ncbi:MAG: hypothetical protein QOG85_142 [Gaiellaceae bacterium]|jgi:hypothetical protein|nr:hypothetical protein [Gaiellaceae bacterium]
MWSAVAAVAAAISSLGTLAGLLLVLRDRRAQEKPRLVLDPDTILFNKADGRVKRQGGFPKGTWFHEMVGTLLNVGPGTAFSVEFAVSATVDGVASEIKGGEFIAALLPQEKREFRTLFSTTGAERPTAFSYVPTHAVPALGAVPTLAVLAMHATARDRSGRLHYFDSQALRESLQDATSAVVGGETE